MTEELKPCPFCNEEPLAHSDGDDWFVRCMNMDCCVDVNVGPMISQDTAIKSWNTRTSPWNADMEAAPRDGRQIAVWDRRTGYTPWVYWDVGDPNGGWVSEFVSWAGEPTHWMPLPQPPEEAE